MSQQHGVCYVVVLVCNLLILLSVCVCVCVPVRAWLFAWRLRQREATTSWHMLSGSVFAPGCLHVNVCVQLCRFICMCLVRFCPMQALTDVVLVVNAYSMRCCCCGSAFCLRHNACWVSLIPSSCPRCCFAVLRCLSLTKVLLRQAC
jgi:hypothetical protein